MTPLLLSPPCPPGPAGNIWSFGGRRDGAPAWHRNAIARPHVQRSRGGVTRRLTHGTHRPKRTAALGMPLDAITAEDGSGRPSTRPYAVPGGHGVLAPAVPGRVPRKNAYTHGGSYRPVHHMSRTFTARSTASGTAAVLVAVGTAWMVDPRWPDRRERALPVWPAGVAS